MATEERKAQLEFEAVDNTKPGLDSVKENLQGVAATATDVANKSASALDQVAKAGADAGQQLDRSTASISASVKRVISDTQRQIATLKAEASGGGTADIFENLISQRGANADALKPLIGNLRTLRTELDTLRQAEQRGAVDVNYERERAAAEQARRRADATAALTQALDQQEAAERRLAGQNAFVNSLKAQSDAIGKTRADLLELQAAQMGVSSQAAPYIAKLREQEAALTQNGKVLNAYGQTAKQTSAALRQVPAQITDIVVSLQGGQAPLTVLLQQGGQLKDVFGGVAPAIKGLATGLLGLITPTTVLVGSVGALALAYFQGSQEADAYNRAIVLTGNAAGVTAGQLKASAEAISQVVGTQGAAAAVLAQLAQTGQVAGANVQRFAEVTLKAERDLKISSNEMVKNFEALGESPVEASLKLTKQYGFLTAATFEQIKALQEQGKTQEAAALAQETYATAMDTKSAQLRTQLGTIERAWQGVTSAAKSGWDAILNVGRAETSTDRLADLQRQLDQRLNTPLAVDNEAMRASRQKGIDYLKEQIGLLQSDERLQRRGAEAAAERQRAEEAGIKALQAVDKLQDKGLSKQEQMNKALREYRQQLDAIRASNPDSKALAPDAVAQGERAIRDQFKEKGGGGDTRGAEGRQAELADLRAKIKAEEDLTARLKEQGIQAEKNTAGVRLADSIQEQLNGTLSKTSRAHLEAKLELAKQLDVASQAREDEAKRQKAIEKSTEAMRKQIAAVYEEAAATEQQRMKLDETTAAYGKTAIAVAQLAAERTKARLAEADSSDSFDPAYVENLRRLLAEQRKLVGSIQDSEYSKLTRTLDDQIAKGNDQKALLLEEISLTGLSEVERKKVIAAREVELKLAKQLNEIDRSGMTDDQKEEARYKAREASRIESANAANRVIVDDWNKTTDQINQSLTDALMRGFESGKDAASNLRDTVKNMFRTMVLRPIISAAVSPVAGAVNSVLYGSAAGAGGGVLGSLGNLGSLWNAGSNLVSGVGSWLGLGSAATGLGLTASAGTGLTLATAGGGLGLSAAGTGLGLSAGSAGSGLIGAGLGTSAAAGGSAAAAGGFMSGISTALPYIGAVAAIASIISGMDDSGTYHTGGAAQYSAAKGLSAGQSGADFNIGFGRVEAGSQTITNTGTLARGLSETLDGLAKSFGRKTGYEIATAFADDTSKDGAWGALRITRAGQDLLNWEDTRMSRWAPREFGDGEEGYKQYLAAVAKDTRMVLLDMDLPSWADKMLTDLGDSVGMEQLTTVITQIGVIQSTFESLAKTLTGFSGLGEEARAELMRFSGGIEALATNAGSFYTNFYSEAERAAKSSQELMKELAASGLTIDPSQGEKAKEQFRQAIEGALDAGQTEMAAKLLGLNDVFAQVADYYTEAADKAAEAVKEVLDEMAKAAKTTATALSGAANARDTAGGAMDRLAEAAGYDGTQYSRRREQRLWEQISVASYDKQIEMADELTGIVLDRYQKEKDAAEKQLEYARSLRDFVQDLLTGELSPLTTAEKLATAQEKYLNTLAQARGGDEKAMDKLQGVSSEYLDLARTYYASSETYRGIFNSVTDSLIGFGNTLDANANVTLDPQNETLQEMYRLYDVLNAAYDRADADTKTQTGLLTDQLTALSKLAGGVEQVIDILGGLNAEQGAQVGNATLLATGQQYADLMAQVGVYDTAANVSQAIQNFSPEALTQSYMSALNMLQTTAQMDTLNGIWSAIKQLRGIDGSHASGLDYVPFDGYRAELHKGERVLTAQENRGYTPDFSGYGRSDAAVEALASEVRGLRADNERLTQMLAQVIAASSQANAEAIVVGVEKSAGKTAFVKATEAKAVIR